MSELNCDILVIGAGIQGAGIAWDAASRGLRVILVDKGDFGGATSAACFKTVHGGIRYLQHLDFYRLRRSVNEQRTLLKIAPHLVQPSPFVIPCYGNGSQGRFFLELGFYLYELLAIDRNAGLAIENKLKRHQFLDKHEMLRLFPYLPAANLKGGLKFYDAKMYSSERLSLAVVLAAEKMGAKVFNYKEVVDSDLEKLQQGRCIRSIKIRDTFSKQTETINASAVVVACGPWTDEVSSFLLKLDKVKTSSEFSKGLQLLLADEIIPAGLALPDQESKRNYFLLPWRNKTLVGTTDEFFQGRISDFDINKREVVDFFSKISANYPHPKFQNKNLSLAFGGLVPAKKTVNRRHDILHRDRLRHYRNETADLHCENLFSAEGVKYTTFRFFAEEVVDKVVSELNIRAGKSTTQFTSVYGGYFEKFSELKEISSFCSFDEQKKSELMHHYGNECTSLAALVESEPDLLNLVSSESRLRKVEIVQGARAEHAKTVADILYRRTACVWMEQIGPDLVRKTAALMSKETGRSARILEEEFFAASNRQFFWFNCS